MQLSDQFTTPEVAHLRRALLAWYDLNHRDLPWRRTKDPYCIWISEIMLQQTRVAAVLPRYEDFLHRFPSLQKLAKSKLSAVLAQWSGLGYYHRARNLHAAAQTMVRAHGGTFPQNASALGELPGIGRYTAAAIASIAFNEPAAVVDGNVGRVLRRLLGRTLPTSEMWETAQQLLDRKRPAYFNQAMMELGATLCLPRQPSCNRCPIIRFCRTRGSGESKKHKLRQQKATLAYDLAIRDNSVLLIQRQETESVMPGMWELPKAENPTKRANVLFTLRHSIMVTDYNVAVFAQPFLSKPPEDASRGKWIRTSRLQELPLTGLAKKILYKAKIIQ